MELPEIGPEERTPLVEVLLGIIGQLLDRVQQLEETNQQLRDEIAILKGQKPRPTIRPSQLESAPPAPRPEGSPRPGSNKRSKNAQLTITQEVMVSLEKVPPGAVLRAHEPYIVQELEISSHATRYWRARYSLAEGGSVLAPLPKEVPPGSHYGPTLISYILKQHHHAYVTQPLLLEELHDFGIDISAGQLQRILTEDKEAFHQEKLAGLREGLRLSSYLGTDDTGARHQGRNGVCTVVGNELFAYFESSGSKSRLNFLQVLHGPERLYAINATALAYYQEERLSSAVIQKLSQGPQQLVGDTAWQAHLEALAIHYSRDVRMVSEGALLGGLIARGVSPELVILSDGAPQFDLLVHASCWVHAERPLHRMVPHNEEHRTAIANVRDQIWQLYKDLKAYRQQPDASHKATLEARFDALCNQRTGYPSINTVLKEIQVHKADLLLVLERPEVPLHNNGSESDIREYVKKRKISGSTRSADGRHCRDTFTSLKKTCRKLGVRFWHYLQDRVRGTGKIPSLPDLMRERVNENQAPLGEPVPA